LRCRTRDLQVKSGKKPFQLADALGRGFPRLVLVEARDEPIGSAKVAENPF